MLIPKDNEPDLAEISRLVLEKLDVRLVEHMDEVLLAAMDITRRDGLFSAREPAPTVTPERE